MREIVPVSSLKIWKQTIGVGTCLLNVIYIRRQVTNNLLSEYLLDNGNLALSRVGLAERQTHESGRCLLANIESSCETHFSLRNVSIRKRFANSIRNCDLSGPQKGVPLEHHERIRKTSI